MVPILPWPIHVGVAQNSRICYHQDWEEMVIYQCTTKKPNRYTEAVMSQWCNQGKPCSGDEVQPGTFRIASIAQEAQGPPVLRTFLKVLQEWVCSWLWEHVSFAGGTSWMAQAIKDESLLAVTEGSYIKQLYPNICSATFILECLKGRGRIIGSFKEATSVANAYRDKLLGAYGHTSPPHQR